MILTILHWLPLIGAAAVAVLAQVQVRERSERASIALTVGAGLEAASLLGRQFSNGQLLYLASPLVQVASVASVVFGLVTLVDELNPKRPTPLPAALATHKQAGPNVFLRGFFGVFGAIGMLVTGMRMSPLLAIAGVVALAAALYGSIWVERQGPLGTWVLERRPELVAWTYVHALRVVNRQTGSSTTHHSAMLGLSNGALLQLPALGEGQAQSLSAAVYERCPGICVGFSPENAARFKSTPEAMRGGART